MTRFVYHHDGTFEAGSSDHPQPPARSRRQKSIVFWSKDRGQRRLTIPRCDIRAWLAKRMDKYDDHSLEYKRSWYSIAQVLHDPALEDIISEVESIQRDMYSHGDQAASPSPDSAMLEARVSYLEGAVAELSSNLDALLDGIRRISFDISTTAKGMPAPSRFIVETSEPDPQQLELPSDDVPA